MIDQSLTPDPELKNSLASPAPMGLIADLIFTLPDDLTNFILVAAVSSNNLATVAMPAAINPGDLLLLFQASTSTTAIPAAVMPPGWTTLVNQNARPSTVGVRYMVDYRIADGSEENSLVTGMDSDADRKIVAQFRQDQPISAIALFDLAAEITDAQPAAQILSSSAGTPPLLAIGSYYNGQTTQPARVQP